MYSYYLTREEHVYYVIVNRLPPIAHTPSARIPHPSTRFDASAEFAVLLRPLHRSLSFVLLLRKKVERQLVPLVLVFFLPPSDTIQHDESLCVSFLCCACHGKCHGTTTGAHGK